MNLNKLFEPFTSDGSSLELTLKWMQKTLGGVPLEVLQQAISEILFEVSQGKDFTGPCECGCGLTNVHSKINHAMRDRARALVKQMNEVAIAQLESRQNQLIEARLKQLSDFDKQFIKMNRPPLSERSPVLRWINGLVRNR